MNLEPSLKITFVKRNNFFAIGSIVYKPMLDDPRETRELTEHITAHEFTAWIRSMIQFAENKECVEEGYKVSDQ